MPKRKRITGIPIEGNLHIDGFTIHRNVVTFEDKVIKYLGRQRKKAKIIFNTQLNDNKRAQNKLSKTHPLVSDIVTFLNVVHPGYKINDWNLIVSEEGCKTQMAHCDYEPTDELRDASNENIPLAALIAINDNTTLRVWKKSIHLCTKTSDELEPVKPIGYNDVYLNHGDILVFRGDLVHAGSAYDEVNMRIHVFMDTQAVKRDPNRTMIVSKHMNEQMRRIIVE